jgi:GT2 family glycosyltransferase
MPRKKALRKNAYKVLIVKPHCVEHQVDERVNQWIMKQYGKGVAEYLSIPSKSPDLARNTAIDMFLNAPKFASKTHIFFLDADTLPCSDYAIERLLWHDKPVVAGVTPIVRGNMAGSTEIDCYWSVLKWDKDKTGFDTIGIDEIPKKPFISPRVGGTTVLIKRDVLEKLKRPYQKSEWNEDCTQQLLSEDFYFCDRIREAGFDIWVDPTVECHHYHKFDLLDIFNIYRQSRKG